MTERLDDADYDLLQEIVDAGGHIMKNGNVRHAKWDRVVQAGYVARTTLTPHEVRYEITKTGREALQRQN